MLTWKIMVKSSALEQAAKSFMDSSAAQRYVNTIKYSSNTLHMTLSQEYHVRATFGSATDTYDIEGKITHTASTESLSREAIEAILPQYRGEILQKPPL